MEYTNMNKRPVGRHIYTHMYYPLSCKVVRDRLSVQSFLDNTSTVPPLPCSSPSKAAMRELLPDPTTPTTITSCPLIAFRETSRRAGGVSRSHAKEAHLAFTAGSPSCPASMRL